MTTAAHLPKYVEIGLRIRTARLRAGLSQESFAGKVGTSRRHVMRLERGDHKPSPPMLERIEAVTEVPAREILGADEDEEESSMSFGDAIQLMFDREIARVVREIARDERGELVLR